MPYVPDPARFLMDSGLLFEINRQVLHPLGLALEVRIEDDGTHVLGGVQDHRGEEGGYTFAPDAMEDGEAKLAHFMEREGSAKLAERLSLHGYLFQRAAPGRVTLLPRRARGWRVASFAGATFLLLALGAAIFFIVGRR